jgi:undecaprenyl-diphosphatase
MVLKNNDGIQKVLLILASAGLCVFFAGSLNDMFVKTAVERWRPTHDGEIAMLVDVVNGYRGGRFGFFSSHAANTFSLAIFFSLLVRSRVLTFFLICWSLINCWTRMYLGVHFPVDICCGLLWGAIVGTTVWFLYRKLYKRLYRQDHFISSHYTSTGYEFADVDIVVTVMLFTILYAILKGCLMLYL